MAKMTILIGSKSNDAVVLPIEARGLDAIAARRDAITIAWAQRGVADPIALTEHEAAVRIRRQLLAQFAPKMPDLNGNGKPGWDAHGRMPCYDNR